MAILGGNMRSESSIKKEIRRRQRFRSPGDELISAPFVPTLERALRGEQIGEIVKLRTDEDVDLARFAAIIGWKES